ADQRRRARQLLRNPRDRVLEGGDAGELERRVGELRLAAEGEGHRGERGGRGRWAGVVRGCGRGGAGGGVGGPMQGGIQSDSHKGAVQRTLPVSRAIFELSDRSAFDEAVSLSVEWI